MSEDNERLHEETQRRLRKLTILYEASQACLSISDQESLLAAIIETAARASDAALGSVMLIDEEKGEYIFGAHYGLSEETITAVEAELHIPLGKGLVGGMLATAQPLVIADVTTDPRWIPMETKEPIRSFLRVPLVSRDGRPLGALTLSHPDVGAFDEDHARLLSTFANQAAIAIENARLYEQAQARSRYLETLQRINATLRSTLPLGEVLTTIAQGAGEVLNYVGSLIVMPDASGERLTLGAVWGGRFLDAAVKLTGLELDAFSLPLTAEENPMARAYLRNELQAWSRAPERIVVGVEPPISPKLAPVIEQAMGARLAVCVPLPAGEKVVGVLAVFSPREQLPNEERAMLLGLADQAGLAIENAWLYEQAQQEIAERKRAIEALRESEERYRRLVELSFDAIVIYREGKIVSINAAGAELLGASSPEELVGKPILDFVHPDSLETVRARVLQAAEERVTPLIEEKLVRLDGTSVDAEVLAVPITYQGHLAVQVVARDITERKRAEEAYRALVEHSLQGLAILQGNSVVFVNPALAEMLGYTIEELMSLSPEEMRAMVHPEDQAFVWGRYQDRLEGKPVPPHYEFCMIRKDGTACWVKMFSSRVEYGGKPAIQAAFIDITERKRAEEALRESELQYRTTLDSMGDAIHVVDTDLRFVLFNKAFKQWNEELGLETDAIGRAIFEAFPFLPDKIRDEYHQVLNTGETLITEESTQIGDREFITETRKIPVFEGGRVARIITVIRDITERKRAEEALAYERDLLHALMDNIPDTIYFKDTASRFTRINKAQAQVLGVNEPEEAVGKTDFDFFTAEHARDAYADEREIMKSGQPLIDKVEEIRKADGQMRWVSATKVPIIDKEGRVTGMVGISRDITERKRVEEALRESQTLFHSLIESLPQNIFSKDLEGRFTFANQRYCITEGKSLADILGKTDFDLHPSGLAQKYREDDRRVIETGQLFETVEEHQPVDGERFYVQVIKTPIYDSKGRVNGILGIFWDITERKRAEEALRASEETTRVLLNAPTETAILLDTEGTILALSETAAQRLGKSVDELVGSCLYDFFSPDVAKSRKARIDEAIRSGEPVFFEDERKGILFDNSIYPVFDAQGKVVRVAVFARDITERKRAEEALRASEERYRALYEDNPSMYFTVDPEGTVLSVNQFGAEQLGYTVEELVGQSVLNVFYRDDKDAALQQLATCVQNPTQVAHWEFRKVRKDGSVLWVKEIARAVRGADGHTVVLIVCEDITERKKLEEQLRQAQKMDAIGQLAGGITHDFNNLLTPIGGFAELLLWKTPEGSQQYEYLRQIKVAAERATALTRQLLAFARRAQVEVHPLDLNDVAREVIGLLERTIDKAIAIESYLADDLAIIEGDAGQLHQVLLNLCLNARDAMPGGGRLVIEAQNVTLSEAKARTELDLEAGQYVVLSVTDTGSGMDAEIRQHLFEPFFTTKEQGRGLGLATAYGIVRGHGGTIHVYSEPGQGSTFKVYLPVAKRPAEHIVLDEAEVVGGTETVLVVDDEEPVRELLRRILKEGGYTVLLAADGVEAVELYSRQGTEIDLVVLDIIMPRMGGRKTYERLREINPEVKVLLSSGYSENGQVRDILTTGASGFLQKPYDLRAVLRKVREAIES